MKNNPDSTLRNLSIATLKAIKKRRTYVLTIALIFSLVPASMAQPTFVSTTPSNKNVILEDFTGRTSTYCPNGHAVANTIAKANPGRFWDVMIHAGSFAPTTAPNYHTTDGDVIHNNYLASISGYPCGMVNRGGVVDRGQWNFRTTSILQQPSCANIAAKGTLDFSTRTLTLTVELYYTADSPTPSNYVTVAMLQNNILGPQTGGSSNPEQYLGGSGNNYIHRHVLRDIIATSEWGDEVTPTTATSFFTITYTYTIPTSIQGIPVVLENLEFLVWVAESKNNIITANQAEITNLNLPGDINAFTGVLQENYVFSCTPVTDIILNLRAGSETIKSLEVTYSIDGGASDTYTWNNRDIPTLEYDTIYIPSVLLTPNVDQVINMQISKINGSPVSLASRSLTVRKNIVTGIERMTFLLTQDRYGDETYWEFLDANQAIVSSGGPYPTLGSNTTQMHEIDLAAPSLGCYVLIVTDLYGDGINNGYGVGNFKVIDPSNPNGEPVLYNDGKFGYKATYMINVVNTFCGGDGSGGDPYLICNAQQLNSVRYFLDKHFKLNKDIDLADYIKNSGVSDYDTKGWMPIGDDSNIANRFTGAFNGAGHTISGLWIDRSGDNNMGLFGYISGATIDSLGVEIAAAGKIIGNYNVGGLAGYSDNSTISNSYAVAPHTAELIGYTSVGGLTGVSTGSINNCYATARITATADDAYVGGLAGYNFVSSSISNSYATGSVKATGNDALIGGVTGYHYGNTIQNCVAANDSVISMGSTSNINRIAGYIHGGFPPPTISNSYANSGMVVMANNVQQFPSDDADLNGTGKAIAELQMYDFYNIAAWNTTLPATVWDIETGSSKTWTIWDAKSLPYFPWQGAPVYNPAASIMQISFELRNAADSVTITVIRSGTVVETGSAASLSAGDNTIANSYNYQTGDAIILTVYESGKASSYPVQTMVVESFATVKWGNTSFTYNGQWQAPTATFVDAGGNTVNANIDITGRNAGVYTATASYPNYMLLNNQTTFTIAPKAITVTALGGSSTYGDSPANPGISAEGLVNGESVYVLTGLSNDFYINATTAPGSYLLKVIGDLTNGNYTITKRHEGIWRVSKIVGAAVNGVPTLADIPSEIEIVVNPVTIPINPGNQTVEYAISTSVYSGGMLETLEWQSDTTFAGPFSEGVIYYVYARSAANEYYAAGTAQISDAIIIQTPTGMDDVQPAKTLVAWMQNDRLYVSGLAQGKLWSVYNISGALVHQSIAGSDKANISLPAHGVYLIRAGENTVRTKN